MIRCSECRNYRPRRSYFEALSAVPGAVPSAVGEALINIQAQEAREYKQEDLDNHRLSQLNELVWPKPPRFFPHCAADGGRYVTAVKNRHQDCRSFQPANADQAERSCLDCKYCLRPTGDDKILAWQVMSGQFGLSQSSYDPGALKAAEYRTAYDMNGTLTKEPQFLPYCTKFSRIPSGPYVICAITNADGRCPEWQSRLGKASQATPPGVSEILLTEKDDWRRCGDADFRFFDFVLTMRQFDPDTNAWARNEYDIKTAPLAREFGLLNRRGEPIPVIARNEHGNLSIRYGAMAAPGTPTIGVLERYKRNLYLPETPCEEWKRHPNENRPYEVAFSAGMVRIRGPIYGYFGAARTFEVPYKKLPSGRWVRPRDRRYRDPLPLVVRKMTVGNWIAVQNTVVNTVLNLWTLPAVEVCWLDD